eukprot:14874930-Alexandrium_andersonii.AAC.1
MHTLFHSGTATKPSSFKAASQRRSQNPPESGCPRSASTRGKQDRPRHGATRAIRDRASAHMS